MLYRIARLKTLLFATLLILAEAVSAQPTQPDSATPRFPYIEPIADLLTLKIAQSSDIESFSVFTDQNKFLIEPNAQMLPR